MLKHEGLKYIFLLDFKEKYVTLKYLERFLLQDMTEEFI